MSGRSKKEVLAMRSGAPVSPAGEMPEAADSRPPESGGHPAGLNDRWAVLGVCIFLAAIIWVVFGQTLHDGFVNLDDSDYVSQNPVVQKGLTLKGTVWAFTHVCAHNWHPLTWISHMLDCQFYGLNSDGHHLTNILLHTATAILLFLVLRRMTGFLGRSAFVAAVFAIHPLRVESVAWVAERKDVLSGLFFMLTLGAYVRYARHSWSPARYGLVVLLFALGLMSKPMLVTLPFVLLLLDYWPLNRLGADAATQPVFRPGGRRVPRRLILEKLPLLGLVAVSCVATLFAQTEIIKSFDQISLPLRVENALMSYVSYLGQMFWPSGLAVFYPFAAEGVGVARVVLSLVVLAGISAGAFVLRRHRPYLLTGWLWYLIMLVPVIGIVQVGSQTRADRYTYLPQIGLYLLLTWAATDLCAGWRHRRVALGGCSTVILVGMIFCARTQASYWRNSETLWAHTVACTSDNWIGHYHLGDILLKEGSVDKAIVHYQKALEINPDYAEAHNNLGDALLAKGDVDEAMIHYQKALQINPDSAEAHYNLGNALLTKGDMDEAIVHYQKALEINPDYAAAHNNLGHALFEKGSVDEAIVHYQKALGINPGYAVAHYNLGNALLQKGNADEAISQFQKALEISPDHVQTLNNFAWVLATCPQASLRNGNRAVELARRANRLAGDGNPVVLGTLAAAYAEAGHFPEAVETARHALQLAETQSNLALADAIRSQLELYQAGVPFHVH